MIASFESRLAEYDAVNYPAVADSVADGEVPYRSGRVFLVRQSMNAGVNPTPPRVHPAWLGLPGDIRATSPDEMGTLIIVSPVSPPGMHEVPQQSTLVSKDPRSGIEIRKQTIIKEWWSASAGARVFDLKKKALIGNYTVKIEDEESRDLVKFVRSMPVR